MHHKTAINNMNKLTYRALNNEIKNRDTSHSASYGLRAVKKLTYNILTDNRHPILVAPVRGFLLSGL